MRYTLSYTLKQTFKDRCVWTALLIVIIGTAVFSFEVLLSQTDSLTEYHRAYTKYNIGFIIMFGGEPIIVRDVNPFQEASITSSYPFDDAMASLVSDKEGVEGVYKVVVVKIPYQLPEEKVYLGLVGVETLASEAAILPYANMWKGQFLDETIDECAVISNEMEDELGVSLDDRISLEILNEDYTFKVRGVFGGILPEELDPGITVVIDMERFWDIMDVSASDHRYSALLVEVADPELGRNVTSLLQKEYGRDEVYVVYQYAMAEYALGLLFSTVGIYRITNALIFITTSAIIVLIRLVDLTKRKDELGLLTAVGWRERDVSAYLLLQSVLVGVISSVLGLMMTVGLGPIISRSLIPTELNIMAEINLDVPRLAYIPYAPLLAISLSTLAFLGGYLYFRRLTPLKMLEET